MRFSDAIREGAKLGPQGYGGNPQEGLCALAAAERAAGLQFTEEPWTRFVNYFALQTTWPGLLDKSPCPACKRPMGSRNQTVWHLNDNHHWTREAIADWYEATFEQPSDEQLVAQTLAAVKKATSRELEPVS